ncbi:MAG: polysaccharide deacetylase family protein [Bacteroidales bacterium]|nr:polysaccharide deacetylase family protein [Bacteroidales bacterium]
MRPQTPEFLHRFFPKMLWKEAVTGKEIYLTFDDGPHPKITPKVLNILAQFEAKACFFCVGDNVRKYPETFQQVRDAGHLVGNHTFHHLKGWGMTTEAYVEDVALCNELVQSPYFRPPYGRIKPAQVRALQKEYQLVMWSVITYDYDAKLKPEACLNKAIKHSGPGDIVVFHDSIKSEQNMLYALPRFLEYFSRQGYEFPTWQP